MYSYFGVCPNIKESLILFEAVKQGLIPTVTDRLNEEQRKEIVSGAIYIWDESSNPVRRWTDGLTWSNSRVVGGFLEYRESYPDPLQIRQGKYSIKPNGLRKRSICLPSENGKTSLRLIAYFNYSDVNNNTLLPPSKHPLFKDIVKSLEGSPEFEENFQLLSMGKRKRRNSRPPKSAGSEDSSVSEQSEHEANEHRKQDRAKDRAAEHAEFTKNVHYVVPVQHQPAWIAPTEAPAFIGPIAPPLAPPIGSQIGAPVAPPLVPPMEPLIASHGAPGGPPASGATPVAPPIAPLVASHSGPPIAPPRPPIGTQIAPVHSHPQLYQNFGYASAAPGPTQQIPSTTTFPGAPIYEPPLHTVGESLHQDEVHQFSASEAVRSNTLPSPIFIPRHMKRMTAEDHRALELLNDLPYRRTEKGPPPRK